MKGASLSRGCGEVATNGINSAKMERVVFINQTKGRDISIIAMGINLAKNIFAVHVPDSR